MTPEEFQKIKEAEKEHLRALKKLKQAVQGIEKRNKVTKAVTDIASTTNSLLDEHESLVEKLAEETALQEARLELALESAADRTDADPDQASGLEAKVAEAKINEDLAKKRASDLVRQMKSQMGGAPSDRQADADPEDGPVVEKTIGRRQSDAVDAESEQTSEVIEEQVSNRSSDGTEVDDLDSSDKAEPAESDVPEKTIGRMKPRK